MKTAKFQNSTFRVAEFNVDRQIVDPNEVNTNPANAAVASNFNSVPSAMNLRRVIGGCSCGSDSPLVTF